MPKQTHLPRADSAPIHACWLISTEIRPEGNACRKGEGASTKNSDALSTELLSRRGREMGFVPLAATRRAAVDGGHRSGSTALAARGSRHPELQFLVGHVGRLKIFVLPVGSGLQSGPGFVARFLDPEAPPVVVINVHDMGGIGQGERLIPADD